MAVLRIYLKVMFKGPLRIYKHYQTVSEPILSDSATAIEFYFKMFSESIPPVWAHEDIFLQFIDKRRPPREPQGNF